MVFFRFNLMQKNIKWVKRFPIDFSPELVEYIHILVDFKMEQVLVFQLREILRRRLFSRIFRATNGR